MDDKIILFPTERIVNKNKAKEDPRKGEKVRLDATKEFVEANVDEIAMNMLRTFVEMAMKTEKPEFTKDLGLVVDILRGMIYRDFEVPHPAQKLADKIVNIEMTRFGPRVYIDYNKVMPKETEHKPHKPLSKDITEEIKRTNNSLKNFEFESDIEFPDDEQ